MYIKTIYCIFLYNIFYKYTIVFMYIRYIRSINTYLIYMNSIFWFYNRILKSSFNYFTVIIFQFSYINFHIIFSFGSFPLRVNFNPLEIIYYDLHLVVELSSTYIDAQLLIIYYYIDKTFINFKSLGLLSPQTILDFVSIFR